MLATQRVAPHRLTVAETSDKRMLFHVRYTVEEWNRPAPVFGGVAHSAESALHARATHTYACAVAAHTQGQVSEAPRHVCVIPAQPSLMPGGRNVRIDRSTIVSIPTSCRCVYIVEAQPSLYTMNCIGGVSPSVLRKHALPSAAPDCMLLNKKFCNPSLFFDSEALQEESSLPSLPSGTASPLSLSSSGTDVVPAQASPLEDYVSSALQPIVHMVSAHIPLQYLLEQRYEKLQNVEQYTRNRSGHMLDWVADRRGAVEAATITHFEALQDSGPVVQQAADAVAHALVKQHVLPLVDASGPVWRWFVEREVALISLRMALIYRSMTTNAQRWAFVSPAAHGMGLRLEPTGMYSMDIVEAACVHLPIMLTGARDMRVDSKTHRIMLTIEQVVQFVIPVWIERSMMGVKREEEDEKEEEDTSALAEEAARIVGDRQRVFQGAAAGRHLPQANVDPDALPDIEDAVAPQHFYPPCAFALEDKLRKENHIKHGERNALINFLLDVGYSKEVVKQHLYEHFVHKGGTDEGVFRRKYETAVYRNEQGKWVDGVRTIPYGMSCERLIANRNLPGDQPGLCVGCPMQRAQRSEDLSALLVRMGLPVDRANDIAYQMVRDGNAKAACASVFAARMGRLPSSGGRLAQWRPQAPRAYFQEVRAMVVDFIAKDKEMS